ncbi:ribosomal protein S18, partial [Reticulomyxa filosa]
NVKYLNQFVNSRGMLLPRFMTGLDKKSQRRVAEAVKRARHMGLMPYTSKLLILDKDKIKRAKEDHDVRNFFYQEKDQYDPLTIEDLRKMYPEYTPDDGEYQQLLEKTQGQESNTESPKGSVDLKTVVLSSSSLLFTHYSRMQLLFLETLQTQLYDVKQEEIDHYEKIKHNEFLRNIKKDIMESIPDYWKKRRQLREQATKAGWVISRDKTKTKHRERIE